MVGWQALSGIYTPPPDGARVLDGNLSGIYTAPGRAQRLNTDWSEMGVWCEPVIVVNLSVFCVAWDLSRFFRWLPEMAF